MEKTILVTGGAGYIGSHLCKALAREGYLPLTYDSLVTGCKEHVKWGPFVEGDIQDEQRLGSLLREIRPLAVIHLAALSEARRSYQEALIYHQHNVLGTASLLRAVAKHPVPYFLFASSASVYQDGSPHPLAEHDPLLPLHPYGKSKLEGERLVKETCEQANICYAILRYFNVAGADPDAEIGEQHTPPIHLIPLLIEALRDEKKQFTLLHEGRSTRDFIHVTDLADSHIALLSLLQREQKNLVLNLGTGVGHTTLEVIRELERLAGKTIPLSHIVAPFKEPSHLVAEASLVKRLGVLASQHSSLSSILETALRWHR